MTVAVQQDCRAGPASSGSARPAAELALEELLEQHRAAGDDLARLRAASPRSSAGASSRIADRQLGSQNTIGRPRGTRAA